MFKPPECITHDDFLAAVRPIFEACGTSPEAVFAEGFEFVPETDDVLGHLRFLSAVDPSNGTEPVVLGEGDDAKLAWPIAVAVH